MPMPYGLPNVGSTMPPGAVPYPFPFHLPPGAMPIPIGAPVGLVRITVLECVLYLQMTMSDSGYGADYGSQGYPHGSQAPPTFTAQIREIEVG